ncbi:Ribonuclease 3 [Candidatus Annandia adelgestsuga]|uniref:Ribonuclease 3 n=1 Tax=Candidatus Annandia adelgestsuga TaxID=1302411 RepID=A0A3Q9CLT2_9ENTR|nr:ribonuclease III [Candidatus Annandia adelgestsuga]AZP36338.1 Ribonuclease 3 [Candidatus Annandia adelgestsuga]
MIKVFEILEEINVSFYIERILVIKLERYIGYNFNDIRFLKLSLTHRSAKLKNNEKLEFLGDAVLSFSVAHTLFNMYPCTNEGNLSRMRSVLVQRSTLSSIARGFQLQKFLYLGINELNFFNIRESFLSNSIEALVGGIYLDSDMEITERTLLLWYKKYFNMIKPSENNKDPKSLLQEFLQKHYLKPPLYSVYFITSEYEFFVECKFGKFMQLNTYGQGFNKKDAEKKAAKAALKRIKYFKENV